MGQQGRAPQALQGWSGCGLEQPLPAPPLPCLCSSPPGGPGRPASAPTPGARPDLGSGRPGQPRAGRRPEEGCLGMAEQAGSVRLPCPRLVPGRPGAEASLGGECGEDPVSPQCAVRLFQALKAKSGKLPDLWLPPGMENQLLSCRVAWPVPAPLHHCSCPCSLHAKGCSDPSWPAEVVAGQPGSLAQLPALPAAALPQAQDGWLVGWLVGKRQPQMPGFQDRPLSRSLGPSPLAGCP